MKYWAMKSEPDVYSFDDLRNADEQTAMWEGVRNYEARNNLRDCSPGDKVLFYHSNARPSGVVGIAAVASEPYPDPTQFDPDDPYFDPDSTEDDPTWWLVDVRAVEPLARKVPLKEIKRDERLADSVLARRGRLSVVPLAKEEYERIVDLGSDA